jgi:glutamate-ammonia-ligase adenylyltransferase
MTITEGQIFVIGDSHIGLAEGDEAGIVAWVERLAALGFRDGAAALRDVRTLTGGITRRALAVRAALPAILQVLQDTPDPDGGLADLRSLVEAQRESSPLLGHLRDHPSSADLLGRVLGTSRLAGELLIGQPQGVDWLRDPDLLSHPRDRRELVTMATARLSWQDATPALRRFKRLELLRLVLRDLGGSTTVSGVGEELTAIAEACLEGALLVELARRAREMGLGGPDELPVRMTIVGMGKLGGRELNYPSDLDVLFVHDVVEGADDQEATALALSIAADVMRALSSITTEGTAFEVDADLRPEGRQGPLSRSLASYEAYWERWAEPWEHQALLKARTVAGDVELGARFERAASTRAYPVDLGDAGRLAMRRMKARLEKERIPTRVDPARHLKLGPGGLSDVEWTVQFLQQTHGRAVPALRTTSTMAAIDTLQDLALVEHQDAVWLRDGFRFVTSVRNRLALLKVRDVDVMPAASTQVELVARSLGLPRGSWQQLEEERLRHARHVRRVTERIFYGMA